MSAFQRHLDRIRMCSCLPLAAGAASLVNFLSALGVFTERNSDVPATVDVAASRLEI